MCGGDSTKHTWPLSQGTWVNNFAVGIKFWDFDNSWRGPHDRLGCVVIASRQTIVHPPDLPLYVGVLASVVQRCNGTTSSSSSSGGGDGEEEEE